MKSLAFRLIVLVSALKYMLLTQLFLLGEQLLLSLHVRVLTTGIIVVTRRP